MTLCKSCGAEIEFVVTTGGKSIPLDVLPREDGNIKVEAGTAYYMPAGEGDRVTHFATCPQAASHRKGP